MHDMWTFNDSFRYMFLFLCITLQFHKRRIDNFKFMGDVLFIYCFVVAATLEFKMIDRARCQWIC